MITVDDGGGEGGKNCQNIDYVILVNDPLIWRIKFYGDGASILGPEAALTSSQEVCLTPDENSSRNNLLFRDSSLYDQ